jgi:hypothetical protein
MFTLASEKNEIRTKIVMALSSLTFSRHTIAAASLRRRFLGSMAAFRPTASPQEKVAHPQLLPTTRAAARQNHWHLRAPMP